MNLLNSGPRRLPIPPPATSKRVFERWLRLRIFLRSVQMNTSAHIRSKCFISQVKCTLHCHGHRGGLGCTNTRHSDRAALSRTFNLEENSTIAFEPSHNSNRHRSNTCGDACMQTGTNSTGPAGPRAFVGFRAGLRACLHIQLHAGLTIVSNYKLPPWL